MPTADPYRDPVLYDLEYADHTRDIPYYVDLARRAGGPVLELAVGNGRIALPVARAGVEVHGIDLSRPMLADLERKLAREPAEVRSRVRAWRADFRTLDPDRAYPLVTLPFNALHHCADHRDVGALLATARRALAPSGVFALDCYLPAPELYGRDPEARYGEREFLDPDRGRLHSWEQSWYDPMAQVHHVTYVYQRPDGRQERVDLHLRMFYPAELLGLVDLHGWDVVALHGDFDGGPVRPDSPRLVMRLRPR